MKNRLKELRRIFKLSQKQFADSLGLATSTVGNWESGNHNVTTRQLKLIAKTYGVSELWLESGVGSMFADTEKLPVVSTPFEYAQAHGCDYFLSKTIETILSLQEEEKLIVSKIIKTVVDSIYCSSEVKRQNDRLNELARTILQTTHYGASVTNNGDGIIDQSTINNYYSSSSGKSSENRSE